MAKFMTKQVQLIIEFLAAMTIPFTTDEKKQKLALRGHEIVLANRPNLIVTDDQGEVIFSTTSTQKLTDWIKDNLSNKIEEKREQRNEKRRVPEEVADVRQEVKKRLNEIPSSDMKKLSKIAKHFDVDISKYQHLQAGLYKMNSINSIAGAVSRLLKGKKTSEDDIFSFIEANS